LAANDENGRGRVKKLLGNFKKLVNKEAGLGQLQISSFLNSYFYNLEL